MSTYVYTRRTLAEFIKTEFKVSDLAFDDEMYEELCGIIRSVNNPYYKKLLSSFFLEDKGGYNIQS